MKKKHLVTIKLKDTFAERIFQSLFNTLNFSQQLFVLEHIENFLTYKENIGECFFPHSRKPHRDNFHTYENKAIQEWYFNFIPVYHIIAAIETANTWCIKSIFPFQSLTLISNKFLPATLYHSKGMSKILSIGAAPKEKPAELPKDYDPFHYLAWCDYKDGKRKDFNFFGEIS